MTPEKELRLRKMMMEGPSSVIDYVDSLLAAERGPLEADARRYRTIELLCYNGDVRIDYDENGQLGVHLEEAAECADGSWFGADLAAAVDAATLYIEKCNAAIKEKT